MRVHELSKEAGIPSKELIEKISALGIEVKSHMSALTDGQVQEIKQKLNSPKATAQKKEEKKPFKKPVKKKESTQDRSVKKEESKTPEPSKKEKPLEPEVVPQTEPVEEKILVIDTPLPLKDLAEKLNVKPNELISKLMNYGVFATITQNVDFDTATVVAHDFGYTLKEAQSLEIPSAEEPLVESVEFIANVEDKPEDLLPRAPVVTILGHVDHGKTSLLDKIRQTKVTETETGGITQHIGAYTIEHQGRSITFLDTPGHEAFTAMRARGAQVTDIAVLVVAADDGVMPQTIEAIDHARNAKVPIIIAINKVDLPNASLDQVKRQLSEHNLLTEDWGGEVISVEVSAKTGKGIEQLLEMILLQADMLELKANPNRLAAGAVIEAKLTTGRGPVATILVQKGTLKVGDWIFSGRFWGRARTLTNDKGKAVSQAGPTIPVEVAGLNGVPEAGANFMAVASDKQAKLIAEKRVQLHRVKTLKGGEQVSLENIFDNIATGKAKSLNLILKSDVQGSIEALGKAFAGIPSENVAIHLVHSGAGDITESDVMLAKASNSIILGFHVRAEAKVKDLAKKEGVELRLYEIIYRVIEDVQKAMLGLLEPTFEQVVVGHAEVRQCFKISKIGMIAGCYVTDGFIRRQNKIRLKREGEVIFEGNIAALKRFKDEVKEVRSGFECGIRLTNYDALQEKDVIEAYTLEQQETKL